MSQKKDKSLKKFIFRWLKHPGAILAYTAITGGLLYGYAKIGFSYIRNNSDSISTDFWIRSLFYLMLLFFSFGVSLVIDRFLNKSSWVIYQFGSGNSKKLSSKPLKSGKIQFYMSLILIMGFSWWFFDKINNNFHSWYKSYGQYMTMMRSSKSKDRLTALKHLSKIHTPDIAKMLVKIINKGTKKEKLTAIWVVGKTDFKDPVLMESIESKISDDDNDVREAALLAISRLDDNPKISIIREIENELKKSISNGKPPLKSTLFSSAFMRSSEFLNIYMELFGLKDVTTSVILTYAIVWMKGATPLQENRIIKRLSKNMSSKSKRLKCITCVALAFKWEALDESVLSHLRREFEAKSSNYKCSPEVFSLSPFHTRDDTINITRLSIRGFKYPAFGKVRYRERILRVLALNRDDSMIPWFKRISHNKSLSPYIRALARQTYMKKFKKGMVLD